MLSTMLSTAATSQSQNSNRCNQPINKQQHFHWCCPPLQPANQQTATTTATQPANHKAATAATSQSANSNCYNELCHAKQIWTF